jgi:hypothetical protein
MQVRQLYGTRAGEVIEMPYAIAQRAIASGTVEELDPPAVADARPSRPIVEDGTVGTKLRRGGRSRISA